MLLLFTRLFLFVSIQQNTLRSLLLRIFRALFGDLSGLKVSKNVKKANYVLKSPFLDTLNHYGAIVLFFTQLKNLTGKYLCKILWIYLQYF